MFFPLSRVLRIPKTIDAKPHRDAAPAWSSLVWLSIAFLAVSLGACQRENGAQTNTPQIAQPPPPPAPFDARLSLSNNSGRIDFNGVVDSKATQAAIENALRGAYGNERLSGTVEVDAVARQAAWADGLPGLLKAFEPAVGAVLRFEGDRIVLSGMADEATRARLREAAALAYPNAKLEGLFAATEQAGTSPNAGKNGADPVKLTKTLNQMPVKFENGSGNVSSDSLNLVAQAADAIRAAPAGTKLLIVGPVVASQDNGNDLFLSKQRAEALKAQLILNGVSPAVIETRGWGQNPDGTTVENATPPPEGAPMRFELMR